MTILDLGRSLKKLLSQEIDRVRQGDVTVQFNQPKQQWQEHLGNQPTINLFLYDVRENNTLRQHHWEEQQHPAHYHNGRHQKRTPFRVDCTYILTTWASTPEDEHHLLSECMLALFRYPILPQSCLEGVMRHQPFDLATQVASHDKLTNPAELWSALDNQLRPAITYTVTIAIDPWQEEGIREEAPVRTLTTDSEQHHVPNNMLRRTATSSHRIAGMVMRGSQPVAGVEVMVKGIGRTAVTDKNGRYFLGPLTTGQHTLQARQNNTLLTEKQITIPRSPNETYDLILE